MGGLAASIAGAVEAARAGTESLQVDVVHEAWIGQDSLGAPKPFAAPVLRKCFLQEGAFDVKRSDGSVITTKGRLGFVGPVAPNGAPGRQEPIDPRDIFTLPSGMKVKTIEVPGGMLNPTTNQPYVRTVWLM